MATLVKFVKNKDGDFKGDITAVFPQLKYNKELYGNHRIMGYSHIGQHTGVDKAWVNDETIPANESEYKALKCELESIGYNLKVCGEKKQPKMITIVQDFFNKAASEIDKKYFPDVKYYGDDKNDANSHYAIELFNNGVIGYDNLIKKLSKTCKDSKENIHKIVSKYIVDFGDYKFNIL